MKVLIVEDDNETRLLLKKYLQSNSVEVITAQDGLAAMTILKSHKVDLIMSDANMLGMDGYVLAKRVKRDADIKMTPFFLYSSSSLPPSNVELAFDLGVDRCLPQKEIQDIGNAALDYLNLSK